MLQRAAGNCAATPKKSNKTKNTNTTPETEKKAGIYGLPLSFRSSFCCLNFQPLHNMSAPLKVEPKTPLQKAEARLTKTLKDSGDCTPETYRVDVTVYIYE